MNQHYGRGSLAYEDLAGAGDGGGIGGLTALGSLTHPLGLASGLKVGTLWPGIICIDTVYSYVTRAAQRATRMLDSLSTKTAEGVLVPTGGLNASVPSVPTYSSRVWPRARLHPTFYTSQVISFSSDSSVSSETTLDSSRQSVFSKAYTSRRCRYDSVPR